ncbi:endolytic transglycosylase MltG [Rhodococcus aerolatus]
MSDDDLGLLGHPEDDEPRGRRDDGWDRPDAWGSSRAVPRHVEDAEGSLPPRRRAQARRAEQRRTVARRRRRLGTVVAVVVLLGVVAGVVVGGRALLGSFGSSSTPDFAGPAGPEVVVRVASGDTSAQIGATLADRGVVASAAAFNEAARTNAAVTSVQPGYYVLPTNIPGTQAVTDLLAPDARVGTLVIPEGRQLDDVTGSTGQVTPGILSMLSQASCATINGTRSCVDVADLRTAAATADLDALGVPEFARPAVTAATDAGKRLEGLIRPGSYDVAPGTTATQLLNQVLTTSAASFQATGLLDGAPVAGLDPYQVLTVASLVEREALPADFAKVARVIYNRLAVGQKLEFDSTVNYPLDVQAVATTDAARATVTPWNTYATPGLPKTPISSPGDAALTAAEQPADGTWLYFVTVDTQGTTVFSTSFADHEAAIRLAQANGVFG